MSREVKSVVIMHYDDEGELTVRIADPEGLVAVLTVDERCPEDRVYEHLHRDDPSIVPTIAPMPWGNCNDAINAEVMAALGLNPTVN